MDSQTKQPLVVYNTLTRKKNLSSPFIRPLSGCMSAVRPFTAIFTWAIAVLHFVRYYLPISAPHRLQGALRAQHHRCRPSGRRSRRRRRQVCKKAKLEQLEPMEIVQKYTIGFHHCPRSFQLHCHRALSPLPPDTLSNRSK